ncbi:unnamed protein product [Mytilus coruscus]|uniref:B box-type domain-containing protein n=1 Tax=Mytilus coruscus TaxID=42192 RepID=A0A6J8DLY0_MYTCO|nr:unnamed protein product [Mytilus coruscus]
MAQTPSKSCALCDKPATLYCYKDKQFLCSQCKKVIHDRVPVCQDHNVVDIHKAGNHIYKPVPVCDSHKKEFLCYCSQCDCLACKECMTSSHNGHITKEIKKITDICRQDVDQIINKLKTKVEELKKTLKTIDGDHSFLIQSGCDSYIDDVEKTSAEIQQIIDHYKHIEMTTAFDFRDTETHNLKGTRVFFQRLYNESYDRLLEFENLLQEPHDNSFFLEWKGLQKEYKIMTEESEQPLSSPRQMSGFNQNTFRRAIIDGIDKQFQMGLKEQETAVVVFTEEVDILNEKLKGKQEEIDNLSELSRELQLKEKKEIELFDENNKLKTEIYENSHYDTMETIVLIYVVSSRQKEKETTVARLTDEIDVLKEKLKIKQEQIDNLSKLSRDLQLKERKEIQLLDENNKLKTEIKERNIREVALQEEQETTVARLTEEMDVLKEKLKVKQGHIDNPSNESGEAILVLIGYPGSGKSETGNTVIGKRVFKKQSPQKQETHDVLDLHLTVRDTTGFEWLSRFDPGFTDTIRDIFNDRRVGEHLKRRTFLIFTCIDELFNNDEDINEDEFEKWLRTAGDIHKLITSFQLDYCVILNEPGGTKRFKHVEQIVRHIQGILERGSEQDTWCHFNEIELYDFGENATNMCMSLVGNEKNSEIKEDRDFDEKMDQEIEITPRKVIDIVRTLQPLKDKQIRSRKIHAYLHDLGSHMTESDVDKLLNLEKLFCPYEMGKALGMLIALLKVDECITAE